jgi:hypothetical protein
MHFASGLCAKTVHACGQPLGNFFNYLQKFLLRNIFRNDIGAPSFVSDLGIQHGVETFTKQMEHTMELIELTDRELDAVAAGQGVALTQNPIIGQNGLVNVGVNGITVVANDVLSHNSLLNNNNTDVAVAVLGIAA